VTAGIMTFFKIFLKKRGNNAVPSFLWFVASDGKIGR